MDIWSPHEVDYDGEKYILRGLMRDFAVLLVITKSTVFQEVTPCRLVEFTNLSEEPPTSTFWVY
jgi:hypothetical protein